MSENGTGEARRSVLFVCVQNAGRSQMAAAYATAMSGGTVDVASAGSEPADAVNPVVVEVVAEDGIDISGAVPTKLTSEMVEAADVVVTMGCGDACPVLPDTYYEDWDLDDPAGLDADAVRPIRDKIKFRLAALLTDMHVTVRPLRKG